MKVGSDHCVFYREYGCGNWCQDPRPVNWPKDCDIKCKGYRSPPEGVARRKTGGVK